MPLANRQGTLVLPLSLNAKGSCGLCHIIGPFIFYWQHRETNVQFYIESMLSYLVYLYMHRDVIMSQIQCHINQCITTCITNFRFPLRSMDGAPPTGMACNFNTVNTVPMQSGGTHSNVIALLCI